MSLSGYISNPWELSELQKQIILHIFNCKEEIESTTHIANVLKKKQPSIQRSIDHLVAQNYIAKDTKYIKRKKEIALTNQGSFAAIYLGANFDEFILKNNVPEQYYNQKSLSEFWDRIKIIFPNTEKRDSYIRGAIKQYFTNNLFEAGDFRKEWTPEQINRMKLAQFQMAKEHFELTGLDKSIRNLNEFLKVYKIEKEPFKEYLKKQKEQYEKALKELDD